MSIPGSASPLFFQTAAGDAAAAGPIKSVRFNSGDSAYLNRTPSSAGNLKKWTWAGWVKRSGTAGQQLFSAGTGTEERAFIRFLGGGDTLCFEQKQNSTWNTTLRSSAVFRDFSAWYHIVVAYDSAQSTAANRVKMYVNGAEITEFSSTTYPPQNQDGKVNTTTIHAVGTTSYSTSTTPFSGYMADVYFIDGSALDATSFGAFDDSGVWQASSFSGTFGTNGFHLFDFANESGIGNDSSGNDNDFTVNNIASGVYSGTKPKWYTTSTLYTTKADVIANGTDRGQSAFTLSTAEFVYLIPNDGGAVGEVCHSSGSRYPSTFYTYVRDDDDTTWKYTGGFGDYQADDYVWDDTVTVDTIPFGGMKFSTQIDLYLIGDTRAGDPYQPTTDAKMSGSFPALINLVGETDVLRDVPTNGDSSDDTGAGGEVSGNYATLNPLSTGSAITLSDGNLQHYGATSNWNATTMSRSGFGMETGKWYWEVTLDTNTFSYIGMAQINKEHSYPGGSSDSCGYLTSNGSFYGGGAQTANPATAYTANATLMFAYDADAKKFWVGQNGTWFSVGGNAGDPANGNYPSHTGFGSNGEVYTPAISTYGTVTAKCNFGQLNYSYSAPSNFQPLCTTMLATPTIADGSEYFDATLYTGNGSTQSISVANHSPDLVWVKSRNDTTGHRLFDTVRGDYKFLESNSTGAEVTNTNQIAITSSGFDTGNSVNTNDNNDTYVAWTWDAGSSTVSNTDGSITSNVRANQSAGFSIISYTGTGSAGTIGHGLNAQPHMVIVKNRSTSGYNWKVLHKNLTGFGTYMLSLDASGAETAASASWFNSTAPTSSVISLGSLLAVNGNNEEYICYAFAPVESYSSMGVYTGNGSSDGPFVYTGFRPAFVMYKRTDSTSDWYLDDYKREGYNFANKNLYANLNVAESSGSFTDFLSNGFKLRSSSTVRNGSGGNFIYAAFSQNPFQANGGLAR